MGARWQQQKDRELKAKDAADAARAAATNAELAAAREQQKAAALAAQAELAMIEEREFRRILAENQKVAATVMEQVTPPFPMQVPHLCTPTPPRTGLTVLGYLKGTEKD